MAFLKGRWHVEGVETGFSTMEIFYLLQIARLDGFCFLHFARCPDDTSSFAKDLVLLIGASSSRIVVGPLCIFEEPLLRDRSRLADDIGKFRKHAAQLGSTGRVQLLGYMTLQEGGNI